MSSRLPALVALLACAAFVTAADALPPPQLVVLNAKKTHAAVSREYPHPLGVRHGDPTVITIVPLNKPKEKPVELKGHKKAVTALEWSADGKQLASGGLDGAVIVWDVAKATAVTTIDHGRAVGAVAFGKDGKTVASAPFVADPTAAVKLDAAEDAKTPGGTAVLWDAATGKEVKKLDGGQGPLTDAVRVPRTDLLATAGANKTLCLWTVGEGKLAYTFKLDAPLVMAVASPDGKRVFGLADGAREVKVFDPEGKKEPTVLKGAKHDLAAVGVSPDGKHLLGVGDLTTEEFSGVAVKRSVFAMFTLGLSEVFNADEHLKSRPCYVWSTASGKVVAKCQFKDLDVKAFGFGEFGLGK